MRAIFLTAIALLLYLASPAQQINLHNLYWSKGTLGLEDKTEKQGFTCYNPGLDVVFFKSTDSHDVKTYHLSKVAWLSYFDNGIHQQREFAKMKVDERQKEKLYEVISLGRLHLIRLAHPGNWEWDEVSRQWMDKNRQDNRYTYRVAYTAVDNTIRMLAEEHEKAISRYIQNYELNCYAKKDREQIANYYRQQENLPLTALSFQ